MVPQLHAWGLMHTCGRSLRSTKYVTACGFTPPADAVQIVPASFTELTTLQLTSVYHHAPLMSVINEIHFVFNTIKNENDIRQHRKKKL